MRAVNLLPSDLRGAPQAGARRQPSGAGPAASVPTSCSAPWPCASPLSRSTCSPATTIKQTAGRARAAQAAQRRGAGQGRRAEALRGLRGARHGARRRRSAAWPTPASTGSSRCATSPARCRRTSTLQSLTRRHRAARRVVGRRHRSAARRDPGRRPSRCRAARPASSERRPHDVRACATCDGVTRVSLSKSDKAARRAASRPTATGPAAAPCREGLAARRSPSSSSSRARPARPRSRRPRARTSDVPVAERQRAGRAARPPRRRPAAAGTASTAGADRPPRPRPRPRRQRRHEVTRATRP